LAADLLVLALGTISYLLSDDSLTALGCFSFSPELHPANRAAELASYPALPLSPLEKHFIGRTGLVPDEYFFLILITQ
jgi:hypothetical protein